MSEKTQFPTVPLLSLVYSLSRKLVYRVVTKQWLSSSVIMPHYFLSEAGKHGTDLSSFTLIPDSITDYYLLA
jgi:hypothetical protein